jgi:hypothetical protein
MENMRGLTAGKFRLYVNDNLLPERFDLTEVTNATERAEKMTEKLKGYGLSYPVSLATCTKWMISLGAKYHPTKKTYYTDKHEDPATVAERARYIWADMGTFAEYSLRLLGQFKWVQMPLEEALKVIERQEKALKEAAEKASKSGTASAHCQGAIKVNLFRERAYYFKSGGKQRCREVYPVPAPIDVRGRIGVDTFEVEGEGEDMVEFFVESSELFDEWRALTKYGGNAGTHIAF